MRKILVGLVIFILSQSFCFAQTNVSFVYINGSNNNDAKMTKWFENGARKLHPDMKAAFEKNIYTQKYFLDNGAYQINKKPVIFFWGDMSHNDITFVNDNLAITKRFSPFLAYNVRKMIAHYLHDAIWVQKFHNMQPVLNDLQKTVNNQDAEGNKVVLFGYSAGTFVTYQFLLTRTPYINVQKFFEDSKAPLIEQKYVKEHPVKNTCMNALGQELAVFSAAGHIILNDDYENFKKNYADLDRLTDSVCIPNHDVMGVINFASPLVLFYSDLSDSHFQLNYYNKQLFKYLIENDMFWITVNYRTDPLGYPAGRNLLIEEIENITGTKFAAHKGFMYDQSDTWGRDTVLTAHTSYWGTRKIFPRAVARAYANGYRYQYDDNFKPKTVKKYQKKYDFTP